MSTEAHLLCHRCGRALHAGAGDWYVVRIEAMADPTPPTVDPDELAARDFQREMAEVMEQLADQSEQEMRDQVHRRLELHLCRPCYRAWIEKPVG